MSMNQGAYRAMLVVCVFCRSDHAAIGSMRTFWNQHNTVSPQL